LFYSYHSIYRMQLGVEFKNSRSNEQQIWQFMFSKGAIRNCGTYFQILTAKE